jgi:Membrane protein putatively involved in post-translational modification of the autoinducing quorum-sensing peptide
MERLAEKIKNAICINNPNLSSEQADTIKFGLECALNEISKIIAYLIIFSIFSLADYYIVALLFFCILRLFAGGYHADTYAACFIVSFFVLSIGILTGFLFGLPIEIRISLIAVSIILAWIYAPMDHPNKPIIDIKRRRIFKYLSVLAILILSAVSFALEKGYGATAVMSVFLEALSLPFGEIKKRRIRYEYTEN